MTHPKKNSLTAKQQVNKEPKSACCGAPRRVCGSDEGTYYYDCQNCGKEFISASTDFSPPPIKSPANEKECDHSKMNQKVGCLVCLDKERTESGGNGFSIPSISKVAPEPPDWMEEFDEKFGSIKHRGFPQNALKSFTASKIEAARMDERIKAKEYWFANDTLYFKDRQRLVEQGRQEERARIVKMIEDENMDRFDKEYLLKKLN